jgi:lauroyl/myristoyl acyltransferase
MTQQVMDIITQAILADPGQWFWYNKRWVLEPVKTEGAADERT